MRHIFLLLTLLGSIGCARPAPAAPSASPSPDGPAILTVGALRAEAASRLGSVVTVRGIVTSRQPDGITIQSGDGGLLLPEGEGALGQELLVTGRVELLVGQLALVELAELVVEQEAAPWPQPVPLTFAEEQESLYVEAGASRVGSDGRLILADGRLLAVQPPDDYAASLLAPPHALDGVSGVLRRTATGWLLVPPLPRDIRLAPPLLSPCEIQGAARESPHRGDPVETAGVITQLVPQGEPAGFFLQVADCDRDEATSDALFVALPPDGVAVGDAVRLRGRVTEQYGRTQLDEVGAWRVERQGEPLPAAVAILPPLELWAARDYLEAREGMRVTLAESRVVAPTNRFGEFVVVAGESAGVGSHILRIGGPLGVRVGVAMADPAQAAQAAVGQRAGDLTGVLDFTFGSFKLLLDEPPPLTGALPPLPAPPTLPPGAWSVATINAENLFDAEDDPAIEDELPAPAEVEARLARLAALIAGPLGLPTLVALQEVENQPLLRRLAEQPALAGRYEAIALPSHDGRGITQGMLVERGRVELIEAVQGDPCAALSAPGSGPSVGCLAGERRLFARPPLVVRLRVDGELLTVITVHFKSKAGGEEVTRPRRVAQGRYVGALVGQLRRAAPDAEVIVLGDLNDDEQSATLAAVVAESGLTNLWFTLPPEARYAYIFDGAAQVLDHILVTPALAGRLVSFAPLHLNADFPHALHADPSSPYRTSDHDPLLAIIEARPAP